MTDDFIYSVATGDSFNPIIVSAVAAAAVLALIFLLFGMKGKK